MSRNRREISDAAIARMQELSDLDLSSVEIAGHVGFGDDVVRACIGSGVSLRTERTYHRAMRDKMLVENPHHTPQSLAPIFRRLRM